MKVHKARISLVVEAVIGVNGGYNHENENGVDEESLTEYAKMWDDISTKMEKEYEIPYYSATITPVRTVYKKEWGCPEGGEKCILVSVGINPIFTDLKTTDTTLDMITHMIGFPVGGFFFDGGTKKALADTLNQVENVLLNFARTLGNSTITIHHRYVDVTYMQELQTNGVEYVDMKKKEEKS